MAEEFDFTDENYALQQDAKDSLLFLRKKFHIPLMKHFPKVDLNQVNPESEVIYLCGNSLGLQPIGVKQYLNEQLEVWATTGVHGHFGGPMPWALCDEYVNADCGNLVGGKVEEVAVMNGLTVNLHLLLFAFYQPNGKRQKILLESQAFPSDYYAFESHARLHGLNPKDVLICQKPREGESILRVEDILQTIRQHGDSIALICFSGVQYYTGQLFPIELITKIGQEHGCIVGWDLAHAVGNVPLYMHNWNVDFACWCSYKYLNSGAGGIAGIFIHEKHHENSPQKSLHGWWSHRLETRFQMTNQLDLSLGAAGFRISNPPILLCCSLRASLDVFNELPNGMEDLREKSLLLTGYLERLLEHYLGEKGQSVMEIITPKDPQQRGAQLSLRFKESVDRILVELEKHGVACDERKPNVIRVAPAPLYNSFHDVWKFVQIMIKIFNK